MGGYAARCEVWPSLFSSDEFISADVTMQAYDLIVIGSGPGGQRAAIQAAKSGKRVAIIEKQSGVGGVCTNTGTIPSKTMREAVLHLSGFYDQSFYGANYHAKDHISLADLNFRVQRVIENEVSV